MQKLTPVKTHIGPQLPKGSYQCQNFKGGLKCELCNHMKDSVSFVFSRHFRTKHAIRGHLVHQPRNLQFEDRFFVYMIHDEHCNKQYVGSTNDMYGRWSSRKLSCNNGCNKTGLSIVQPLHPQIPTGYWERQDESHSFPVGIHGCDPGGGAACWAWRGGL